MKQKTKQKNRRNKKNEKGSLVTRFVRRKLEGRLRRSGATPDLASAVRRAGAGLEWPAKNRLFPFSGFFVWLLLDEGCLERMGKTLEKCIKPIFRSWSTWSIYGLPEEGWYFAQMAVHSFLKTVSRLSHALVKGLPTFMSRCPCLKA